MLTVLPEEKYDLRDILISRDGTWHMRGVPVTPVRALSQVDVILNALHGGVGEDGTVQRILERTGVPYAGSRSMPSGLALNKIRARDLLTQVGIRMPRGAAFSINNDVTTADMAHAVFQQFGPPYMVKPPMDGAGKGIRYAAAIVDLPDAIADVLDEYGAALVEEYVRGEEVSVGLIEDFRDEKLYALPPAHVTRKTPFVFHERHLDGSLSHTVPSRFSFEQKLSASELAKAAHNALGLSHFSRADIIITPRAAYLLEINSIPGLYPGASFPHMLEAVGSSVREFLEHAIHLARSGR